MLSILVRRGAANLRFSKPPLPAPPLLLLLQRNPRFELAVAMTQFTATVLLLLSSYYCLLLLSNLPVGSGGGVCLLQSMEEGRELDMEQLEEMFKQGTIDKGKARGAGHLQPGRRRTPAYSKEGQGTICTAREKEKEVVEGGCGGVVYTSIAILTAAIPR